MTNPLREALERARPILEAGLEDAERDLETSRADCEQLEELIHRVRTLLSIGVAEVPRPGLGRRHLHEAMLDVLKLAPNRTLRAPFLARQVNFRRLYLNRDGAPVTLQQVHARASRYPDLFERTAGGIRARV